MTALLQAVGVSKTFARGDVAALAATDFLLHPHEVVVLMGPSGSGKSTLLRLLNGLEAPTSGTVEFAGLVVGGRAFRRHRHRVGMVFQQFNLFPHLSALENVALAPRRVLGLSPSDARKRAAAQLTRVGLAQRASAYPRHLSGGQQQRVAIARALAMEPEVLLFDEPTSALDPETAQEVLTVMRVLAGDGMAMVVVTHAVEFARQVADRALFLEAGQLVHAAPASEFFSMAAPERVREFLAAHGQEPG